MRKELDDLLCERYPKIFAERHEPETLLSWGFAFGDGWFDLVDVLCRELQYRTSKGDPQVLASQVKEKFGLLSFHWRGEISKEQRAMISLAEGLAQRICEQCGSPGQVLIQGGIRATRCTDHALDGAVPVP